MLIMENKPVILIVEDDPLIAEFLVAKLEASGYRTHLATNGKEAISMAFSHCPALVLLDLGLPDIDGMEVLAALRAWSIVPVIVVSARLQDADIVLALDTGADDYIVKPINNLVLMARIRTALRKNITRMTQNTLMHQSFGGGHLCIDYDRRLVTVDGDSVHLTPIEYKILARLASNAGRVMTYAVLRRELWGPYATDNQVLRVNMANLRRKIESNSADPQYILTEVGVGYRMAECDTPT
jgi:two-component system KDP operon response regulator KdpE